MTYEMTHCGECFFFIPWHSGEGPNPRIIDGTCHRHAPLAFVRRIDDRTQAAEALFPRVYAGNCCGEGARPYPEEDA